VAPCCTPCSAGTPPARWTWAPHPLQAQEEAAQRHVTCHMTTALIQLQLVQTSDKSGSEYEKFCRFEGFTVVTMENAVFWDVPPCGYSDNRRFGGTCRLHLQGRKTREQGKVSAVC
jgi:hypothetical protein